MRVAFICPLLPPHYNGCGDATDRLAREFQARGDMPLVLTDDVESAPYPYPVRSVGAWGVRSVMETKRHIDEFGPDVVLMQYTPFLYHPRSLYPFLALRALRRYRRITYVHECFYPLDSLAVRGRAKAVYLRLRDEAVITVSDRVYVASPQRANALLARVPRVRQRVRVVPFGANVEPQAVAQRRTPRTPYRVLAFGIVMPRRRIDLLIRALSELHRLGVEAQLDIAGRIQDEDYVRSCRSLTEELGLAAHVRFIGALPPAELERAFDRADLFFHAAEEGAIASAGSLLAALAHGVPVLCARTAHDDARYREAAIFADAEPRSIAVAAAGALLAPDKLHRHGRHSRRLYVQEFGWERMADRIALDAGLPGAAYAAL